MRFFGACCASVLLTNSQAQQPTELIVRNGLIVTAEGRLEGDLRIRGETIAEIGRNLTATAGTREIDARGMLVVPGGVDPHTHLVPELPNPPRPNANQDDYVSGSQGALAGGVTTVSNFIGLGTDEVSAFATRVIGQVQKSGIADFFIHVSMGNDPTRFTQPATLKEMADRGFTSTGEDFLANLSFDRNALGFYKAFKASGAAGVVSMLHCEDASILADSRETMVAEGRGSLHNVGQSAPIIAEVVAVQRGVAIAEATEKGFAAAGGRGLLEAQWLQQKKFFDEGQFSPYLLAETCSLLGSKQEALQYLEAAYDRHADGLPQVEGNPVFFNLRNEPAFQQLLAKIGLPPHV